MTPLQRLAFERIETINKECLKTLPQRFPCDHNGKIDEKRIEIEPMKLLSVVNLLLEQRDLIDALNVEDGEGFENE